MTDLLFPPWLRISSQRVDIVSNTASAQSIFTGATRTLQRGGDRMRFSISTQNASNNNGSSERAALMALRAAARGQGNRIWYSPAGYVQRGSFPSGELLVNNLFNNGSTSWTASAANMVVSDNKMQVTGDGTVASATRISQSVTVAAYNAYAGRVFVENGGASSTTQLQQLTDGTSTLTQTGNGLLQQSHVPLSTIETFKFGDSLVASTANYFYCSFPSLSRCAVIDNGPNILIYSDQLDNAAWTKNACSINANSAISPDGSMTGDRLVESATTNVHYLLQGASVSSAAADYAFTSVVSADIRGWCWLQMVETAGGGAVLSTFKLDGTLGTITSVGSNWSNLRRYISALGNGWYAVTIVARKTNAATTINCYCAASNADSVANYAGSGTAGIYVWRTGLAQSSHPVKLPQTTSASTTGTRQTESPINVKGLPVSTNGLLLPADYVQIGSQLNQVVAPLNSDAAGLGYLQLAYPLRNAPADNDPVIINKPMGRFVLTENTGGWDESPGGFSNHDFVLEEALDS